MSDEVRQFVVQALREMNYEVDGVTDDTPLGEGGVDLESLAIAELGLRVEEEYGVTFTDEENEQLLQMTVGEFVAEVEGRAEPVPAGGRAE